MALKRTQLFDANGEVVYPEIYLKTINGESLFSTSDVENDDIVIENKSIECGYASVSYGLNDHNINKYCYKINGEPQWYNYFWDLTGESTNAYPYMWIRIKKNDNEYTYKPWVYSGEDDIKYNYVKGDILQVSVDSKNMVVNNNILTTEVEVYKNKNKVNISAADVIIKKGVIKSELFNNVNNISDDFISYKINNGNLVLELKLKDCYVKGDNYSFGKSITITIGDEILYINPKLIFISNTATEIDIDYDKFSSLIFDLQYDSDSIALQSNGKVYPFENGYKRYVTKPMLYLGNQKIDILNDGLILGVDENTYEGTINIGTELNAAGSVENIYIDIYDNVIFKNDNIVINARVEYKEIVRECAFLLIGVKNGEKGEPGRNGKDANILTIDLNNDMDQVFVDDKNVVAEKQIIRTTATIFIGNEQQEIESGIVNINNNLDASIVKTLLSNDRYSFDIEITFDKGVEIKDNKVVLEIELTRKTTEDFPESYGVEKSINFNIIKINGKVDNDLVPMPTYIKYVVDPSTGANILDTEAVSMGIRRREVGTTNNEVLLTLPNDLSLGYIIDNDTFITWLDKDENGVVSLENILSKTKGNMPTQLAKFYLYNSAVVNDEESYIDYVSIDTLYDATLPVLYQLTTNLSSIFVDDNGILEDNLLKLGIKKSIGNSTIHYTEFNNEELEGLTFKISVNDSSIVENVSFEAGDVMQYDLSDLDYEFEMGGYIEIALMNGNVQLDSERLHIIRNGSEYYNYIVDFSNDAEQIRISKDNLDTLVDVELPISVEFNKNNDRLKITECSIGVDDNDENKDKIELSTYANEYGDIREIKLTIKQGYKFDASNLNKKVNLNFVAVDGENTVTKMKMFTLYPTTKLTTFELKTTPSYLKFDTDGNVVNNSFNIEIYEKGETYTKVESDNLENKKLSVYATKNGVNAADGSLLSSLDGFEFDGINTKNDITQTTNLCFILKEEGNIIDYVNIESLYDGEKGVDGQDGDGVEYIFALSKNGVPSLEYTKDSSYQEPEFTPDGWFDEPQTVTKETPYQYISKRTYNGRSKEWGDFSTPKLWNVYSIDVIQLDLSNENASIACDSNGDFISGANRPTSQATLYYGNKIIDTEVTFSVDNNSLDYGVVIDSSGYISFDNCNGFDGDMLEVKVTATYAGNNYTKVMTITKVKPGVDGTSPTIYWLQPSHNVIKKNKNGYNPSGITVNVYRQTGNEEIEEFNESWSENVSLYYKIDNGNQESISLDGDLTIDVGECETFVEIILTDVKNNVLDKETIPVVADGENGEPGVAKMIYPAGEWSAEETYKSNNNTVPYVFLNVKEDGKEVEKYYVLKDGVTSKNNKPGEDNGVYWTLMDSFNAVYTKLLVAEYGTIGGAVFYSDEFNNNYMFSTEGKCKNDYSVYEDSSAYWNFMVDVSMGTGDDSIEKILTESKFIPNTLINFTTGDAFFATGDVVIRKNGLVEMGTTKINGVYTAQNYTNLDYNGKSDANKDFYGYDASDGHMKMTLNNVSLFDNYVLDSSFIVPTVSTESSVNTTSMDDEISTYGLPGCSEDNRTCFEDNYYIIPDASISPSFSYDKRIEIVEIEGFTFSDVVIEKPIFRPGYYDTVENVISRAINIPNGKYKIKLKNNIGYTFVDLYDGRPITRTIDVLLLIKLKESKKIAPSVISTYSDSSNKYITRSGFKEVEYYICRPNDEIELTIEVKDTENGENGEKKRGDIVDCSVDYPILISDVTSCDYINIEHLRNRAIASGGIEKA